MGETAHHSLVARARDEGAQKAAVDGIGRRDGAEVGLQALGQMKTGSVDDYKGETACQ